MNTIVKVNTVVKIKGRQKRGVGVISADLLKELEYDPLTGNFVRTTGKHKGKIAGSKGAGYRSIRLGTCRYHVHILAWYYMTGKWPDHEVDHINHNLSDNRWVNLREATRGQNQSNTGLYRNNSVRLKGVSKAPNKSGRFRARIRKDGKEYQIGTFDTPEEAHQAYIIAATKMHGEFVRVE